MIGAIISWIVIGLIVGFIARAVVPGRQTMGVGPTAGLGIAGAFLGGIVSWAFTGIPSQTSVNHWPGWIMAVLGSVVILLILYRRRGSH